MPADPTSFKDLAHRVNYAHKNTQRQYDKYPPNDDMVPIAAAINAWTLVCGCYMGIEQTMKLLIRMRGGVSENKLRGTHDLACLYSLLDPSERAVVTSYYRVYRSLHNFDTGSIALDTADEFIRHIGDGYTKWRYILVENPEPPKTHLGLMLETWRALAHLAVNREWGPAFHTLADYLESYIMQSLCHAAENDTDWQKAALDENSGVEFRELHDWFHHQRRPLVAGIELLNRYAQGTGSSVQASPLARRVLLRAADKAVRGPYPNYRRDDITMFHRRIRGSGLAWNADKEVFE